MMGASYKQHMLTAWGMRRLNAPMLERPALGAVEAVIRRMMRKPLAEVKAFVAAEREAGR